MALGFFRKPAGRGDRNNPDIVASTGEPGSASKRRTGLGRSSISRRGTRRDRFCIDRIIEENMERSCRDCFPSGRFVCADRISRGREPDQSATSSSHYVSRTQFRWGQPPHALSLQRAKRYVLLFPYEPHTGAELHGNRRGRCLITIHCLDVSSFAMVRRSGRPLRCQAAAHVRTDCRGRGLRPVCTAYDRR